jgi:alpha-ketoglutarate-dependent taurine dioxygenase
MRALAAGCLRALAACSTRPTDKDFQLTPEERQILRPLPAKTPEKVLQMVAHGDELFVQATPAYRRADPEAGSGWETQNAMAIDLYTRARESYEAAQAEFGKTSSTPIQDRFRECLSRLVTLARWKRAAQR